MFCEHCGESIDEGSAFCDSCGNKIEPEESANQEFTGVTDESIIEPKKLSNQTQTSNVRLPKRDDEHQTVYQSLAKAEKNLPVKKIITIAATAVVLVVGGFFAWRAMNGQKPDTATTETAGNDYVPYEMTVDGKIYRLVDPSYAGKPNTRMFDGKTYILVPPVNDTTSGGRGTTSSVGNTTGSAGNTTVINGKSKPDGRSTVPSQAILGRDIPAYRLVDAKAFTQNNPGKMMGKEYRHGFYTSQDRGGRTGSSAYYNIDNKYTNMSGLYGPMDDTDSGDTATLTVYGDERRLATFEMRAGDTIKPFNLDIAGISQVRFEYSVETKSRLANHHFGVADATLSSALVSTAVNPSVGTQKKDEMALVNAPINPPQPPARTTLNAGTTIRVITSSEISTANRKAGDGFEAVLNEDITSGGRVIARRGTLAKGVISESDTGGHVRGVASITLTLTSLTLADGSEISVKTNDHQVDANSSGVKNAAKAGAKAGIRAAAGAVGGIFGGRKGAKDAASATVTAAGTALVTGNPAGVTPETQITFTLTAPLSVEFR